MKLDEAGIYGMNDIFKGKNDSDSQKVILSSKARIINIPAYQRPYKWDKDYIAKLFDDYFENVPKDSSENSELDSKYFIGSSVFVNRPDRSRKYSGKYLCFDVVDGQQRITTLFLLNYIRYLFKRDYIIFDLLDNPLSFIKKHIMIEQLCDYYVGMIGKDQSSVFNVIKTELNNVVDKFDISQDSISESNNSVQLFKKTMCEKLGIAFEKGTIEETEKSKYEASKSFLDSDVLCLAYSRDRYTKSLKEAMSRVYIKKKNGVNDLEIKEIEDLPCIKEDDFSKNYIDAMKIIFNKLWEKAKANSLEDTTNPYALCEKAGKIADRIINDLEICVIMTSNEDDAFKLFEVLNDRALKVDDLELIKNLFYQNYCQYSNDSEKEQDDNIALLDELWTDRIFGELSSKNGIPPRFISYLAAAYLGSDGDLLYKDDVKFKDSLKEKYFEKNGIPIKKYSFDDIFSAFNVYFAVKIILNKFGISTNLTKQNSLSAENDGEKSISYKALHILNAKGYHAVMPALINVIISTYCQGNQLNDVKFEEKFKVFIDDVLSDKDHKKYLAIHSCGYSLWRAALMSKSAKTPREIASKITKENGYGSNIADNKIDIGTTTYNSLKEEMKEWITDWKYTPENSYIPKVLMLNLIAYKYESGKLFYEGFKHTYTAKTLELDHLESKKMAPGNEKNYFMNDNIDERKRIVNGRLGNFMILEKDKNTFKDTTPLIDALKYYDSFRDTWLYEEIEKMIKSEDYFDLANKVPKEAFFTERTNRLKDYFLKLMDLDLSEIRKKKDPRAN